MAASSTSITNPIIEGSKQYPYPSHVNPAGFVSVKLHGRNNYQPWQEQMMCLVESFDMLGFIDGKLKNPNEDTGKADQTDDRKWKRSDTLVKGWIFGSLTDNVMGTVVGLQTANKVWDKLRTTYTASPAKPDPPPEIDYGVYVPLYRAIQSGNWEDTQKFLEENKDALTDKLNYNEERTLHVAVGNPDNVHILKKLLEKIDDPATLQTLVDRDKENALHAAAWLDNTKAARILVKKNPDLLFIVNNENRLPIESAIMNSHKKTFLYLFEVCKEYIYILSDKEDRHNPFEDRHGALLLEQTICSGFLDDAYELLKNYPKLATKTVEMISRLHYTVLQKRGMHIRVQKDTISIKDLFILVCS